MSAGFPRDLQGVSRYNETKEVMKPIQTTITVGLDHTATLRIPDDVSPGQHRAVLIVEQNGTTMTTGMPLDLPAHDVGPWPANLSLRREDLYGDDGR